LKKTHRLIGGLGLDGNTGDESEKPGLGYWGQASLIGATAIHAKPSRW
jgi:hypothetical protein